MDNGASSYRRFLEGDEDGFIEIVRDYKDGLMLYINSFTNNIHIAEELTEETFVKLALKKPRDSKKSSFKTWLYTIGRNTAIDYLRKNSKLQKIPLEECPELTSDEESVERAYIKEENRLILHRAMQRLKPEHRQILWLIYFEGFSNKEAGKIIGKSTHNTETLVYRARLSLKAELDKEGYIYENL